MEGKHIPLDKEWIDLWYDVRRKQRSIVLPLFNVCNLIIPKILMISTCPTILLQSCQRP